MRDDATPPTSHAVGLALTRGIALFNRQRWFEAHEMWEQTWRHLEGRDALFFQGLIQLAVCLEHARRGNVAGCLTMFDRAAKRLAGVRSNPYMGVDHRALKDEVGRWIEPLRGVDAARPAAAVPVDFTHAPRIKLIEGSA